MDPNATLTEIRAIVAEHNGREFMSDDTADRLTELVESLDEWLSRGGFLPSDWAR